MTINVRRYFGSFMAAQMKNRIKTESAVGINPVSMEWNHLALELLRNGDNMIAGDYTNYDSSHPREFLMSYLDLIQEWYNDCAENQKIRYVLWCTLIAPLMCVSGRLFWLYSANPSGNAATVFINNGTSKIAPRYAYYDILRQHNLNPVDYPFCNYVALQVFGDDNIMSVQRDAQHLFHPKSLSASLADIQMIYTDEQKSKDVMTHFRKLRDCTFLKRHFDYDESHMAYMGRLDFDTIMEIPNWTYNDVKWADLAMSIAQVFRELALYPKEIFDVETRKLLEACKKYNYPMIVICSYKAYRSEAFQEGFIEDVEDVL